MEFFNNIVLKVDNSGYIRAKFICQKCGKSVSDPADFIIPCTLAGIPLYHLTKFTCKDCCEDKKDQAIMDKLLEKQAEHLRIASNIIKPYSDANLNDIPESVLDQYIREIQICMGMTPEEVGEAIKEYKSKKG